jgi:hypothetical protein
MDEIGGSGPCGERGRRKRQRKKEERLIKIN